MVLARACVVSTPGYAIMVLRGHSVSAFSRVYTLVTPAVQVRLDAVMIHARCIPTCLLYLNTYAPRRMCARVLSGYPHRGAKNCIAASYVQARGLRPDHPAMPTSYYALRIRTALVMRRLGDV